MWTFVVLAQRGNSPMKEPSPFLCVPTASGPVLATGVSLDLKVQYPNRNPELVPEIPIRGLFY